MQVPDLRLRVRDRLAVHLHLHVPEAVRHGVLRPHVDPELRHSRPPSELPPGDVLAVDLLGEVLPERMELEVRREQDPLKVRVAFVLDPHEVPRLPFVEVRGPPEARHARDLRIIIGDQGGDLHHASVVVVLDMVDAVEMVLPIDRGHTRKMLEPERVLQVRADGDQVRSVDGYLEMPGPQDLPVRQLRAERRLERAEDLLLDQRHGAARDLRHRLGDGAHIWMTSSFLSAYCVATNMIPRNRKIENLAAVDEELRRPPHAKAQRRRNTAATSKTTKMRANM